MTIEQLEAANENREREYEIETLLGILLNRGIYRVEIHFDSDVSHILNREDAKYLKRIRKVLIKEAKKELKHLDNEFNEL